VDHAAQLVQMNRAIGRWDFTTISNRRWRLTVKEYLFARLVPRHEHVSVLPHAYRVPLTLTSCSKQMNELVRWLNWLNTQATTLGQVSQEHCDRYLIERVVRYDRAGIKIGTLEPSAAQSAPRSSSSLPTTASCSQPMATVSSSRPGTGGPPARSPAWDRRPSTRHPSSISTFWPRCSPRRSTSPRPSART
jgi:hypothetical protein